MDVSLRSCRVLLRRAHITTRSDDHRTDNLPAGGFQGADLVARDFCFLDKGEGEKGIKSGHYAHSQINNRTLPTTQNDHHNAHHLPSPRIERGVDLDQMPLLLARRAR